MDCLDDATVYDLVRGEVPASEMRRIDDHVDSCELCREVVVATARTVGGHAPALRAGEKVGRYVIVSELGRGGFGVVYRAEDPSLGRPVAIKMMRAGVEESFRARLHREAKAMARLSHPNVVTVYEVGAAGAATFIAMELVDGDDLRIWLSVEKRSVDAIRDVFVQAGEGLAAAHEAGLLHRDFKLDNVIVGRDGRVRVTDFGLARGVGEAEGSMTMSELEDAAPLASLTVTGVLLGTPAYMAPEQLRGEPGDPRSDQYSFCVSFFEALHGCRPFEGATLRELRENVLDGRGKQGATPLPAFIERALVRGLSRDAAQRFEHMGELVSALRGRPPRRWPWAVGLAVGAVVVSVAVAMTRHEPQLCTGGGELATETWSEERSADLERAFTASGARFAARAFSQVDAMLDRWRDDWTGAHADACEATRLRGEQSEQLLDARMSCLERQRAEVGALVEALGQADTRGLAGAVGAVAAIPRAAACADVASLSEVAPPPPEAVAEVKRVERLVAQARALLATGDLPAARKRGEEAVTAAESVAYDPIVASARAVAADVLRHVGELASAEDFANQGLLAAKRARDGRQEASAWLRLAAIAGIRGAYDDAERACRQAEATLAHAPDATLAARLHSALGVILTQREQYDAASEHLQRALSLRSKAFGPKSLEVASVHTNLGNLLRAQGKHAEAEEAHRSAQDIDRRALGEEHPNEARHRHNIARLRLLQGDVAGARALYESALELEKGIYGDLHPEVGVTHNSLGILFERDADYPAARTHYEAAVKRLDARRPVEATMARLNLARLLTDLGQRDEAREHLAHARELARKIQHEALSKRVDEALAYLDSDPPFVPTAAPKPRPPVAPPAGPPMASPEARPPSPLPTAPPPKASVPPLPKAPERPAPPKPRPPSGGSYMPGQAWD